MPFLSSAKSFVGWLFGKKSSAKPASNRPTSSPDEDLLQQTKRYEQWQYVSSSNVVAFRYVYWTQTMFAMFGRKGPRSTYRVPAGAISFDEFKHALDAPSKGKWWWRNIRWSGIIAVRVT